MSRRVVVTGLGLTSPVGNEIDTFWSSLCSGKSGIGPVTLFDTTEYPCKIAGEVKDIDFSQYVDVKEVKRTDRAILLAIVAAKKALDNSALDMSSLDMERCGTIIGSGIGGLSTLETEHSKLVQRGPNRVSPFLIPMMIPDMSAGMVSILRFQGT